MFKGLFSTTSTRRVRLYFGILESPENTVQGNVPIGTVPAGAMDCKPNQD